MLRKTLCIALATFFVLVCGMTTSGCRVEIDQEPSVWDEIEDWFEGHQGTFGHGR